MRQIRDLAQGLAQQPDNLELAMTVSSRQLAMGVAEADPRFVGYAQATLARWWKDPGPPPLVVLRARILQARHDYAAAVGDLRSALQADPKNLDAQMVLASVDEVTGDLGEAQQACEAMARQWPGLAAIACRASVASLTGNAADSYRELAVAVERKASADRALQIWALTVLGEIAVRLDKPDADRHFREALALDTRNVYALTTYADYLLDQGRAADIIPLLSGFERIDALLLRLALACRTLGDPRTESFQQDLAGRYLAARLQGDTLHLRDASRFALVFDQDPRRALELAQQNWQLQKSPTDARVLLEAAVALKDREAARPIADWMAATHLEDATLSRLLARLEAEG